MDKEIKKRKIGEMELILLRGKSELYRKKYWHYVYTIQLRNKIRWLCSDGIWNNKKKVFEDYDKLVQSLKLKPSKAQSHNRGNILWRKKNDRKKE